MTQGLPSPGRGRLLADVLSFGWVLPASIGAGAGLGWLADRFFRTFPVLTIVFALLGAAGGFLQVYREMESISREAPGDDPPAGPGPS